MILRAENAELKDKIQKITDLTERMM